jgi:hypothetical protein
MSPSVSVQQRPFKGKNNEVYSKNDSTNSETGVPIIFQTDVTSPQFSTETHKPMDGTSGLKVAPVKS